MSMSHERPLQSDMFSGELKDTRTRIQKRRDQKAEQPQALAMFSQRDVAQFGVTAHPTLPISDHTKLALQIEDPRTPEEIERDTQHEAEIGRAHV